MSDDEYDYDYGSDADQDDEQENEGDPESDELIEIENAFYEGDELKDEDPAKAIEMFEKVVSLETTRAERGEPVKWRFKALQHMVTIHFGLGNFSDMIARYRSMLGDMSLVTRNECTEAINAILEALSSSTDVKVLVEMFEVTLVALNEANNERLWFNTNLKLAKLYMQMKNTSEVERLISILKQTCQRPDGSDDPSKGTNLLEVYCLEMELCTQLQSKVRMRQIYSKTKSLDAAVADPRVMAVIHEEGGKMQMSDSDWDTAYNTLYSAFRNYQEAGNQRRAKDCLKYVVLASMFSTQNINPFAAPEAMVFHDDKEILAMSELRRSQESDDLKSFEKILKAKQNRILEEPVLMAYIEPLRRRMREHVLLNLTRPYQKVTLQFLANELSMEVYQVEGILVDMILDGRMSALIDQIKGFVTLGGNRETIAEKKMKVMGKWADALKGLNENITHRLQ